jgi:carbonic anhydrase
MISAQEAIARLREGNRRFVSDDPSGVTNVTQEQLAELAAGQQPFAVIVGCSDSRVPVELVFDQGMGDLFIVRVAGNIVSTSQLGSVEFAVEEFGTPVVVVLGHSNCGAVTATVEEIMSPTEQLSPNLSSIVEHIRPSVESLLETDLRHDREALVRQVVLDNVRASVDELRKGSEILQKRIHKDELLIVGAKFSLKTGIVDFFDGVAETRK